MNKSIALHKKLAGKLEIKSKAPIESARELALLYTPGVGAVSSLLGKNKKLAREYTIKKNSVAVISDGSAVLGLGNIGAEGAIPVLEGKCIIFKKFANVDAWPIALDTQDTESIIATIKAIAPVFGGINLEDISAPRCFEIERRLMRELDIPVMHDDQHGTAIVVLAALINALKVVKKNIATARIVVNGAGPAGTAVVYLLREAGVRDIVILDSHGVLASSRKYTDAYKQELAAHTNPRKISGNLESVLRGADVFIGVSRAGALDAALIRTMSQDPIIFALANPIPEIMPDEARAAGARIIATGRSDFPNQINNALVFPGVFRGVFDAGKSTITMAMKKKAAIALASLVKKPDSAHIIPSIFDARVAKAIARAMR
ncbi:MAG: NADP-dependent malic enzyme [Patescibacteria group bacterium]